MAQMLAIEAVTNEVRGAISLVNNSDTQNARDKCVRAIGLLDFVCYKMDDSIVLKSLQSISNIILSLIDELAGESLPVQVPEVSLSDDEEFTTKLCTSFSDVVGNDNVKQALYESVVLQKKLHPLLR
jgi:hypothetical protein